MMSNLSPAAQAVLDAFLGDSENTGLQMDDLRENVAAALKTAVKLTRKRKVMKTLGVTMAKGPIYCLESELLAIVTELKGHDAP
jgi:hypothetical protein